jgi:Domain of unknown function (DUF4266)
MSSATSRKRLAGAVVPTAVTAVVAAIRLASIASLASLASLASIASLATVGCAHVAPYERGNLARPSMSAEDPFTTPLAAHVQDVSEGATGGLSGGGGGCGCN